MGKLVIRRLGKVIGEVNLRLGDMKIGRKSGDIVLDDPAVSSQHAVITTVGNHSTIYDLNSTNGTFVDGRRVQKHDLENNQTVVIGEHALVFREEFGPIVANKPVTPKEDVEQTMMIRFAHLLGIDGKEKGKRVSLTKETVTLEIPGKNPARISRLSDRYLLEADADPDTITLNNHPMPDEGGVLLENGDVIEIGGTKFQFNVK